MKKYIIQAEPRNIIGRKVKALRREGQIPATLYGKKIKSQSLTVPADAFKKVYVEAGETGLIDLKVKTDTHPVLINTVQIHPVNDEILHVEFRQVDLKEKVKTHVPVEFIGVADAVTQKTGVVLELVSELDVEALPTDLPEKITVDVSGLTKVDDELTVANITVPKGVTVLTDKNLSLVRIAPLVSKEAEAEAAAEAAAVAETAAQQVPAEEGVVPPTEGETPAEEKEKTGEKIPKQETESSKKE